MKLIVGGTLTAVAMVAAILLWFDGLAELAGYQLVLVVLAAMAVRRLRPAQLDALETTDSSLRLKFGLRQRPPRAIPPQLERIERLVAFGKTTAFDADWRLLPFLRSIASEQLETRHGLHLDSEPDLARRVIGEPGWELLNPSREQPIDRMAPGLSIDQMAVAVSALEEI